MVSQEKIRQGLEKVIDPELNFDIVTLGLVYDIRIKNGEVETDITLTSPGCPFGPEIITRIKQELEKIGGVKEVKVNLVWEPVWNREKIDPLVRAMFLGGF